MENVEVFSKYPVTNNEWLLYCSLDVDVNVNVNLKRLWGDSLGTQMMRVCLDDGGVSDVLKSEILKFNDVYDFYMRKKLFNAPVEISGGKRRRKLTRKMRKKSRTR